MLNFCKQCGKEISTKQIFCSHRCSATYNNLHRSRKSRHRKDVKLKPIRRYCEHCGQEITQKGFRRVCPECSKFQHYGLYRKLGLSVEQPLRDSYKQAYEFLRNLYTDRGLSVIDIYKSTGVCHKTLKLVFEDFGDTLRSTVEGQELAVQKGKISPGIAKQYKHGWHTTWEGIQVFYRSSYELEFAKKLDSEKIPYRMESLRVPYWDSGKQRQRVAIPDFYLPETGEIIEVKSFYTYKKREMQDKFEAYVKLGYVPKLLLERRFIKI